MLITAQSQMEGKDRERFLAIASSSSRKKPKSRKNKRNVLRANKGGGQMETKGKEVQERVIVTFMVRSDT